MKFVGVERFMGYRNAMVDLSTANVMDNIVNETDKIFDSITSRQLSKESGII